MDKEKREPESIRRKKRRNITITKEEFERISLEDKKKNKRLKKGIKKECSTNFLNEEQYNEDNNGGDEGGSNKKKKPLRSPFKHKNTLLKKVRLTIKILIGIFLLLILISFGSFFGKIQNNTSVEPINPKWNESVNILLLGMDIGDTSQVSNNSIKRTDTILLVNYNKHTKKTTVISIPRDTLITENNSNYKVNAAYVMGGDEKIKSVVENLLDVNINYIAKVNYEAFRDFIDSTGGVSMYIERDMIYDDDGQNLHINFKGGTTVDLDGKKAEEFFRWRKNNDGTGLAMGDLDRIKNQQILIQKVVKKCTNPFIIFRMPKILNSIGSNIDTNMSAFNILKYVSKMIINKDNISMVTLEGSTKTISGQSYFVYEEDKNIDLLKDINTTVKGDNTATTQTKEQSVEAKIIILNGTETNGLAAETKEKLIGEGYSNIEVGNIEKRDKSIISTNDSSLKKSMKKILKIKKTEPINEEDSYNSYDIVIIIGEDYKG